MLEQLAKRICVCPIPGNVQDHVGFEQPGLVKDGPTHGKGFGASWPLNSLSNQAFHDSIIFFRHHSNQKHIKK